MLGALWHLIARSWANMLAALSSSNLSFFYSSVFLPILVFTGLLVYEVRTRKPGVSILTIIKGALFSWPTQISVGLTVAAWIVLLAIFSIRTIYKEHNALVAENSRLEEQISDLIKQKEGLSDQLKEKPKEIIKTITQPPPGQPRQCWFSQFPTRTFPDFQGMHGATEILVFCNKNTAAPYHVDVTFASNSAQIGKTEYFPANIQGISMMTSSRVLDDRTIRFMVGVGQLSAYHCFVIRAHTPSSAFYPIAESAIIQED